MSLEQALTQLIELFIALKVIEIAFGLIAFAFIILVLFFVYVIRRW